MDVVCRFNRQEIMVSQDIYIYTLFYHHHIKTSKFQSKEKLFGKKSGKKKVTEKGLNVKNGINRLQLSISTKKEKKMSCIKNQIITVCTLQWFIMMAEI